MFVQIAEFPDYMVNDAGIVVSLKGGKATELKPVLIKRGYYRVTLYKNNKAHQKYVHRIVATCFLGISDLDVNHKDGNKINNHVDNLEYVTHQENMSHAFRSGLCSSFVGERSVFAKLSTEQVNELRKLKGTMTQEKAASLFNTARSNVSLIWSGKGRKYA